MSRVRVRTSVDVDEYLKDWEPQPIEWAQSLPSQMYTSKKIYRLEQERFFAKAWLYVGHLSQLKGPGSYFTVTVAEQPLLVVQDLEGQLRGFYNVCPHRAGPIATGYGACHRLTCTYHAWTFDLKGELKASPHMGSTQGFKPSDHALRATQIDIWESFIFVNLDPECEPLISQLGELPQRFERYGLSQLANVHSIDYFLDANWKLYVENSAESYHLSSVHPSLELFKNIKEIEVEAYAHYYIETTPLLSSIKDRFRQSSSNLLIQGLNESEMGSSSILIMWPNFILVLSPSFVLARTIDPQGLVNTRVRFEWLVPDTAEARSPNNVASVVELYDKTMREDVEIINRVQVGVRSLNYVPGSLSTLLEIGTHQFQQSLMEHIR